VLEVHLVVLDPAHGEGELDLERPQLGRDLIRGAAVDRPEFAEDLVALAHVALVELVVGLDRGARDAVELQERGLQLAGPDLLVTRHAGPPTRERRGAYPSAQLSR
jgi:hypothetical protein